jgi:predicted MPP superfamily phosphohydrolase
MMRWERGVAAAAAAGLAASGAEALALRRRVREITIPTLPTALDGLTILHASDVHAGHGPGLTLLRRSARWAAELQPDIVAVTGDLVARRRAAPGFAEVCSELVGSARHAAVAVLGNHDLAHGRDPFAQGWEPRDLGGVTLLDGAAIEISVSGHRVCIGGASAVRMLRKRAYDPTSHLDPTAELRVLLCHFPHMLPRLAPGMAHLVLAGHLHGGQICVPWPGGRISLAYPRSGPISAVEASNGTVMHISPGLGTTFVPLRLLAQPEVTLLRLRSS